MKVKYITRLALVAAATLSFSSLPAGAGVEERPIAGIPMSAYESLATGMTYEEAVKEIGRSGWEVGRIEVPNGPTTIVYRWHNRGGANLSATFQDGELVAKTQFGLR